MMESYFHMIDMIGFTVMEKPNTFRIQFAIIKLFTRFPAQPFPPCDQSSFVCKNCGMVTVLNERFQS